MNYETASREALIERIAELEGQITEIVHDVGEMASEAEQHIFKDTGNTYDFDEGRRDGLEDAITTITTIAGYEHDGRQCDVIGHSWQPLILDTEYIGSGIYINEREMLECRVCGVKPHTPVYTGSTVMPRV